MLKNFIILWKIITHKIDTYQLRFLEKIEKKSFVIIIFLTNLRAKFYVKNFNSKISLKSVKKFP